MEKKKFAVIGGGWSGIYALKYLLEEQLDARLYEREPNLGGVWLYKEAPGGVYRSTHVTSSKTFLHASDFPMAKEIAHFPKHDQVLAHLNSYADYFNLWSHMHFTCDVVKIEKGQDDQWRVRFRNDGREIVEVFDGVVIAVGQHQTANDLRHVEPLDQFTGTMSHSISYKEPDDALYCDKTILIVGGGETASDLAVELCRVARRIYMSIRGGQWFQERLTGDQPADIHFTKSLGFFGFYDNIWVRIGWSVLIRPFWGEGGTGIIEWKPRCRLFHGFINKSREVVHRVAQGIVIPKRAIASIKEKLVTFDGDGKPVHIDHILLCTGYIRSHPFLDENLEKEVDIKFLYQLIFPVNLPNLAFVGTARPVFGSIPSLAELQARRVAQIFSGRAFLPSPTNMSTWLSKYWKRHTQLYPFDARLRQLVNQFEYTELLAHEAKVKPNLWRLFFSQPRKWYTIYFESPWTPFLFRMNTIESEDEKLAYARHVECIPRPDQPFGNYKQFIRSAIVCAY
ncbi:unnamed protein product [Didymodactylos carnosus]|uniref:Flavin-containing monooxygenase n=1 Tax=Didymodactylos carnosus TaxID=1234261 RepID=A0A8S2I0P6_9BILA|nr:unnamed protein product [Didymodactylos carnosus]CAF3699635.1 unnamed protein product [Didymodactylos carnosus]